MPAIRLLLAVLMTMACASCIVVDSGRPGNSGSAPGHNKGSTTNVIVAPTVKVK